MHILEKMAIENYAKTLYEEHKRVWGYDSMPIWGKLLRETRDTWREKAEELLNEGYYNGR